MFELLSFRQRTGFILHSSPPPSQLATVILGITVGCLFGVAMGFTTFILLLVLFSVWEEPSLNNLKLATIVILLLSIGWTFGAGWGWSTFLFLIFFHGSGRRPSGTKSPEEIESFWRGIRQVNPVGDYRSLVAFDAWLSVFFGGIAGGVIAGIIAHDFFGKPWGGRMFLLTFVLIPLCVLLFYRSNMKNFVDEIVNDAYDAGLENEEDEIIKTQAATRQ
jgi:hypothetical protein